MTFTLHFKVTTGQLWPSVKVTAISAMTWEKKIYTNIIKHLLIHNFNWAEQHSSIIIMQIRLMLAHFLLVITAKVVAGWPCGPSERRPELNDCIGRDDHWAMAKMPRALWPLDKAELFDRETIWFLFDHNYCRNWTFDWTPLQSLPKVTATISTNRKAKGYR